ncbi:MAG: sigma-54-dependent Fis family transcriptional regulator [bacterium]|nr:sigma-54-dependent Fis family transcriptional regulator [bacterium]
MEQKDILIVDDDENMNFALSETLLRKNYIIEKAFSYLEAKEKIGFFNFPLVITDVRMPDGNGIKLVGEIKKKNPNTCVIVITAYGKIEDAVTALKNGADDYILKPFSADKILKVVERLFPKVFNRSPVTEFLTKNSRLQGILDKAARAAGSNASILISGESGTGKEVLARHIYRHSRRQEQSYIAINCAAIPDNLLESELFGHEKGAFTGADKFKPGKFELADKGTLVLDEIGDMPMNLQAKILRVLQEKEVDRLGGKRSIPVDVRVISLTNQDIKEKLRDKTFREDLLFRLNVIDFDIPPLRERPEDIDYLTRYFLGIYGKETGRENLTIAKKAMDKLMAYSWPGNVRELQNVMHRTAIFSSADEITEQDIEFKTYALEGASGPGSQTEITTVAQMEKDLILRTLEKTQNNKTKAAEILGISSRTLRNKLNEYSLDDGE